MGWNYTVEQMASIIRFFRTILLCNIFWRLNLDFLWDSDSVARFLQITVYLPWKLNRVTLKLQQPLRVKTHLGMLPRETILDWLIDWSRNNWLTDDRRGEHAQQFLKRNIFFFFYCRVHLILNTPCTVQAGK